jgi:hypothetical protein
MQVEEYFRDKSCVITGAASGIGFALTEALLQVGGVVLMADRDRKTLASAVEQLGAYAGQVHSMSIDVTNQEQVQHMVEDTASRHGRLDILFNNAGIGGTLPFGDVTLEHWRRIIDLNLGASSMVSTSPCPSCANRVEGTSSPPHLLPGSCPSRSRPSTAPPSMRWSASVKACVSSFRTRGSIFPSPAPEVSSAASGKHRLSASALNKSPRPKRSPPRRLRRLSWRALPTRRASLPCLNQLGRFGVSTGVLLKPLKAFFWIWLDSAAALTSRKDGSINPCHKMSLDANFYNLQPAHSTPHVPLFRPPEANPETGTPSPPATPVQIRLGTPAFPEAPIYLPLFPDRQTAKEKEESLNPPLGGAHSPVSIAYPPPQCSPPGPGGSSAPPGFCGPASVSRPAEDPACQ